MATAGLPSSGVLQVALQGSTAAEPPYEAVAAQDSFMLTAKDWVGEPGRQLQYEFRFQQVTGSKGITRAIGFCQGVLHVFSMCSAVSSLAGSTGSASGR